MTIVPHGYRIVQAGRLTRPDDLVLVCETRRWERLGTSKLAAPHVHARRRKNDWIVIRKIGRDTQRHEAVRKVVNALRTGRIKL